MKKVKYILFFILIILLSWGIVSLKKTKKIYFEEVSSLENNLTNLENENANLIEKINYLKNNDNLIKEIKSQTNYKKEQEKLIIIIPETENTKNTKNQEQKK
jgi:cell division protein FtsB